ncbi:Protein-S-isoprenylcysteine O-methyltransferase Ste14 [Marinospirillum celere]|uniref:Protein-S-isoprenylcysteine O-methyltransferase Ste14 n=1 Tax=Marinospirillum celere TaxID=1122252 RepID=A0A1I1H4Q7_9GAMM|nr:isoprenylcysteine carboxylmethyltransferase family protein [Marinospirillum celere]SFC16140.1 Protein-S-isoprenylcysteine O-methyltransferase Ste14 [Marinospirillum celere]
MHFLEKKIPPLLLLIGFLLLLWTLEAITPVYEVHQPVSWIITLMMLLAGSYFCLAGISAFKKARTTVDPRTPEKTSELVTEGVYRITRNPMYVGFGCFLAAWGAWLASPWLLLVLPLFLGYLHLFQVLPEEAVLEEAFGEDYLNYKAKVPRWM